VKDGVQLRRLLFNHMVEYTRTSSDSQPLGLIIQPKCSERDPTSRSENHQNTRILSFGIAASGTSKKRVMVRGK
jgi:hypothetical protein